METIYVAYGASDRQVGQSLVTALQQSGAHVWDDAAMQQATDLSQATVFQACHQFVVVLSREALRSPQLRSQVLHYVTLHHWSADFHVTLVVRDNLATRDLWLFIRHFPRIEQGDLSDATLVEQVTQAVNTTAPRRPSTRISNLMQQAGLVQEALITPSRYRRSWAKTWRLQIFAASAVLLMLIAFLVSSTLLVKHAIIDRPPVVADATATPGSTPAATATVGVRPIFQATSTNTPRPSPAADATAKSVPTVVVTSIGAASSPTPAPTPTSTPVSLINLPANNKGISDDSNPTLANYDGVGFSYSTQTLQAAGFVGGTSVVVNGVTFAWPGISGGDNVIAGGQVIPLSVPPTATTIAFLGSATEGASSGTGVLTYANGSTQPFTLAFSDWTLGGGSQQMLPSNTIAVTLPYRNYSPDAREYVNTNIYYTAIAFQDGKVPVSVTLPANSGPGALHVIAIGTK